MKLNYSLNKIVIEKFILFEFDNMYQELTGGH